eukprot:COSAG01_NODE_172_length_23108_cov_26.690496_21_plen_259_part_00
MYSAQRARERASSARIEAVAAPMSVHAAGCLLRTPPGSARQPRSDAAVAQARRCIAAEIERLCHRAHRPGSEGVRRRVAQLRGLLARTASSRPRRRGARQGAAAAAAAAARPTAAAAVQRRADALHRGVPVRLRSPNTAAAAVALALTPLCPPPSPGSRAGRVFAGALPKFQRNYPAGSRRRESGCSCGCWHSRCQPLKGRGGLGPVHRGRWAGGVEARPHALCPPLRSDAAAAATPCAAPARQRRWQRQRATARLEL